jgi:mannan endo-1,4-beta-mannosidase
MARSIVLALVALVALACAAAVAPARASSFVAVSGHQLTVDGAPFYFLGGNAHWLADPGTSDQGKIDALFGAALALGMRVIRTWAFSERSPSGQQDFSLLDYAVDSAARHDLRLILALGNTWRAYGGPEKWLDDANGKTIAEFYSDASARSRYRVHIARVTSRYSANPTVMGYDVLNEPRCPGCDGSQQAARDAWLDEMSAAVRSGAPNQLVLMGSEGFFSAGSSHVSNNPGAGTACEGDDFEKDSAKASAATAHLYWRLVEATPDKGWTKPGFDDYVPYLAATLGLREQIASSLGKPLIVEEFGLTTRFFDQEQVKAVVALVLDRVVRSKQQGGALAGALIWGLVPPGSGGAGNQAGYNIDLDGSASASGVGLGSAGVFVGGGGGASNSNNTTSGRRFYRRRHLQEGQDVVEDTLDAFRRGPQRASCANARAPGWSFPYSFARATGVSAEAVESAVSGTTVSSLFKEAAEKL